MSLLLVSVWILDTPWQCFFNWNIKIDLYLLFSTSYIQLSSSRFIWWYLTIIFIWGSSTIDSNDIAIKKHTTIVTKYQSNIFYYHLIAVHKIHLIIKIPGRDFHRFIPLLNDSNTSLTVFLGSQAICTILREKRFII